MSKKKLSALTIVLLFAFPLMFVSATTATPDALPTRHIIENVPYVPMYNYWATCAVTSLKIQMKYFGVDYPLTLLMNLDWAYGAFYGNFTDPAMGGIALMYPNTAPVPTMQYVTKILGCNVTEMWLHNGYEDANEAWETLKSFLAKDIPVVCQWSPHTVVAVGYDESPELPEPIVYFHDPTSPTSYLFGKGYGKYPTFDLSNLGAYTTMNKTVWMSDYYWYAGFQSPWNYYMMIARPPKHQPTIPWWGVMIHNANKTLALGEWASTPPTIYYGYEATAAAANDIENYVIAPYPWMEWQFDVLFGTISWGPAERSHSAAFLAALADKVHSEPLEKAAEYFEYAGFAWDKVIAYYKYGKANGFAPAVRAKIVESLREVSANEKLAGQYLMIGAMDLVRPGWPWWWGWMWFFPGAVIPAFIIYRKRKEK